MAKKKVAAKVAEKPRRKPARRTQRSKSSSKAGLRWFGRIVLICIVVALLFWQWSTVSSWLGGAADATVELFGWGLLLLVIALIFAIWGLRRWRLSSLFYRWYRWVGGVAFILAIWGILARFGEGGILGYGIIGFPTQDYIEILRIVGLGIVGGILGKKSYQDYINIVGRDYPGLILIHNRKSV